MSRKTIPGRRTSHPQWLQRELTKASRLKKTETRLQNHPPYLTSNRSSSYLKFRGNFSSKVPTEKLKLKLSCKAQIIGLFQLVESAQQPNETSQSHPPARLQLCLKDNCNANSKTTGCRSQIQLTVIALVLLKIRLILSRERIIRG